MIESNIHQFSTTTLIQPKKNPPSMETAPAQPVIPPSTNAVVVPPTKPPTAAAIRKQEVLQQKIALAAQMEYALRAKEQETRASESRPASGLTDAMTDRFLSIGLRRSTRAKVDDAVKVPKEVASQVNKVAPKGGAKGGARGGAQGRGARGRGARGGARGGAHGGKADTGAKRGANGPATPIQQMPLVSVES